MDEQTKEELLRLRKAIEFLAREIDRINKTYAELDNTFDETQKILHRD